MKRFLVLGLLLVTQPAHATCGMFWECIDSGCKPNPVCDTAGEPVPDFKPGKPPIVRVPPEPTTPFNPYEDDRVCRRAYICNDYRNCAWEILCR